MTMEDQTLSRYLSLDPGKYYVIGEIGVNHNGEIENAKKLIDLAKRSGCDAVKFQKRTPDVCTPSVMRDVMRETPWGEMTYLQYRHRIEFNREQYEEIDRYCNEIGITWFASAWDIESIEFLDSFSPKIQKVASAMNTHLPFLRELAQRRIFTIISTGMASLDQIDEAVAIFIDAECPYMLFHTTSVYPAKDEQLNVSAIRQLQERYKVPIGYSGHESTLFPTLVAAVLGARVIERHITLDRALWGTDQAASLAERGLRELVADLTRLPVVLGDGKKKIEDGEDAASKRLRYWI